MISGCSVCDESKRHVARVALTPANEVEESAGLGFLHFRHLGINLIFQFAHKLAMMQYLFYSVIHGCNETT
jgi:hypothetical protein